MSCPICNDQRSWPIPFADDPDAARLLAEAGAPPDYEWRLCRRCGNAYPSQPPDIQVLQRLWTMKRGDEGLTPEAAEKAWEYRRRISRAGAARSFRQFAPLAAATAGALPRHRLRPRRDGPHLRRPWLGRPRHRPGSVDRTASPRARHQDAHRPVRAERGCDELRHHPHRACDLFHHRPDELHPHGATAAQSRRPVLRRARRPHGQCGRRPPVLLAHVLPDRRVHAVRARTRRFRGRSERAASPAASSSPPARPPRPSCRAVHPAVDAAASPHEAPALCSGSAGLILRCGSSQRGC